MDEGSASKKRPRNAAAVVFVASVAVVAVLVIVMVSVPPQVDGRLIKAQGDEVVLREGDISFEWEYYGVNRNPANATMRLVESASFQVISESGQIPQGSVSVLIFQTIDDAQADYSQRIRSYESLGNDTYRGYGPVDSHPVIGDEATRFAGSSHPFLNQTVVQDLLVFRQQNVVCLVSFQYYAGDASHDYLDQFATDQDRKISTLLE